MNEFLMENANWIILNVFIVALCVYSFVLTGKERKLFRGRLATA